MSPSAIKSAFICSIFRLSKSDERLVNFSFVSNSDQNLARRSTREVKSAKQQFKSYANRKLQAAAQSENRE